MNTTHKNRVRIFGRMFLIKTIPIMLFVALSLSGVVMAQPANNLPTSPATAQQRTLSSQLDPSLNPNSSAFKIAVCDGPRLPDKLLIEENVARTASGKATYVACDFNGVMLLVQHLINIMLVIGVLAAVALFSWAGYLYITGTPGNVSKAHAIFPKVIGGFIIMLSAWFIVYQILSWLTDDKNGFKTLLGN